MAVNPFINLATQYTSTVDAANDGIPFWKASTGVAYWISNQTFNNIAGAVVGTSDSQTLTNKTLTSPTISGPTLSGTISGTYTIGGTPTFPSSVVTLSGSQTLTNKTLTSPTISGGSLDNATVTVDTVAGHTTSNTGTIYGISVASGVITTAGSVGSGANATNGVQAAALATNAIRLGYASITTNFTTSTASAYVDVTGLSVTVTVPSGGRDVKITVFLPGINTSATAGTVVTAAVREGSTTLNQAVWAQSVASYDLPVTFVTNVSAPSVGSHTYKVSVAQNAAGTISLHAGNASTYSTSGTAFIWVEVV
jgi:hypothetical protein